MIEVRWCIKERGPPILRVRGTLEVVSTEMLLVFFLRISILKDQKEQQNQHLEKLHRISDELKEQAVALGEKLDNTSEKHLELLRR